MPEDEKIECSELEMAKLMYDGLKAKISELEKKVEEVRRYARDNHIRIAKLEKKVKALIKKMGDTFIEEKAFVVDEIDSLKEEIAELREYDIDCTKQLKRQFDMTTDLIKQIAELKDKMMCGVHRDILRAIMKDQDRFEKVLREFIDFHWSLRSLKWPFDDEFEEHNKLKSKLDGSEAKCHSCGHLLKDGFCESCDNGSNYINDGDSEFKQGRRGGGDVYIHEGEKSGKTAEGISPESIPRGTDSTPSKLEPKFCEVCGSLMWLEMKDLEVGVWRCKCGEWEGYTKEPPDLAGSARQTEDMTEYQCAVCEKQLQKDEWYHPHHCEECYLKIMNKTHKLVSREDLEWLFKTIADIDLYGQRAKVDYERLRRERRKYLGEEVRNKNEK